MAYEKAAQAQKTNHTMWNRKSRPPASSTGLFDRERTGQRRSSAAKPKRGAVPPIAIVPSRDLPPPRICVESAPSAAPDASLANLATLAGLDGLANLQKPAAAPAEPQQAAAPPPPQPLPRPATPPRPQRPEPMRWEGSKRNGAGGARRKRKPGKLSKVIAERNAAANSKYPYHDQRSIFGTWIRHRSPSPRRLRLAREEAERPLVERANRLRASAAVRIQRSIRRPAEVQNSPPLSASPDAMAMMAQTAAAQEALDPARSGGFCSWRTGTSSLGGTSLGATSLGDSSTAPAGANTWLATPREHSKEDLELPPWLAEYGWRAENSASGEQAYISDARGLRVHSLSAVHLYTRLDPMGTRKRDLDRRRERERRLKLNEGLGQGSRAKKVATGLAAAAATALRGRRGRARSPEGRRRARSPDLRRRRGAESRASPLFRRSAAPVAVPVGVAPAGP